MLPKLLVLLSLSTLVGCFEIGEPDGPTTFDEARNEDIKNALPELTKQTYSHKNMESDDNLEEKFTIKKDRSVMASFDYSLSDDDGDFHCQKTYKGKIFHVSKNPYDNRNNFRIGNEPAMLVNASGANYNIAVDLYSMKTNLNQLNESRKDQCREVLNKFAPTRFDEFYLEEGSSIRYSILTFPDFTYNELLIVPKDIRSDTPISVE